MADCLFPLCVGREALRIMNMSQGSVQDEGCGTVILDIEAAQDVRKRRGLFDPRVK